MIEYMKLEGVELVHVRNFRVSADVCEGLKKLVEELPLEAKKSPCNSDISPLRVIAEAIDHRSIKLVPHGRIDYTGFQNLPIGRYNILFSHYPGGVSHLSIYDRTTQTTVLLSPNK